ncbi:MAG: hypothetical protein IT481_08435 [Gammaproteobacteria bacterium]|nr:hypothetical protein [Gammaproteobacteria bacterium]
MLDRAGGLAVQLGALELVEMERERVRDDIAQLVAGGAAVRQQTIGQIVGDI